MNISSGILLVLIAGISFFGFLMLAALVWLIRARRFEKGNSPASVIWRSASTPATEAEAPAATMESKPFEQWIRRISPGISTLMDLDTLVKQTEDSAKSPISKEEKRQEIINAIEELAEKQPDNVFLRQMRDSMHKAIPNMDNSVKVIRVGTTTTIAVDGKEYSDAESIPDPDQREKVRRILKTLGSSGPADQNSS